MTFFTIIGVITVSAVVGLCIAWLVLYAWERWEHRR